MNKYQEALDRVLKFVPSNYIWSDFDVIGTLQELVDKATPMKPRYRPSGNIKCWCGLQMYEEQQDWYRYCASCGQRIDWSGEDQ